MKHLPLFILLAASPALAQPLSTAFTFQGELTSGTTLANGTYDLRFSLFDAAAAGNQQGPLLCSDNVAVVNGKFTVQLDFGSIFRGEQSFLEVQVRPDSGLSCSNSANFTILGPRQAVTAAPNALFALSAVSANDAGTLGGQSPAFYRSASNLNTGTIADTRLSTNIPKLNATQTFTGALTLSNPANSFAGNGAGLLNLNAANISSGLLPLARGGTGADTSAAATGQVLKFNGTAWLPGADQDTLFTAGPGLVLNNNAFSIASGGVDTIAIQDQGILNSDLSDFCVSTIKIANGAITGVKIPSGAITSSHIFDGSIASNDIATGGVSSLNIIDGTIAAVDLGLGAVTSTAILDGTINSADLAVGSVNSGAIIDGSVTSADIANGTITGADLATATITGTNISPDTVANTRLASDSASLLKVSGGVMNCDGFNIGIGMAAGSGFKLNVNGAASFEGQVQAQSLSILPAARVCNIIPSDFALRDQNISTAGNFNNGEPNVFNNSLTVAAQAAAPIHLPQGALITRVQLWAVDSSNGDISVLILRREFDNTPGGTIASLATSGNTAGVRLFTDSTISGGAIDNFNNMYYAVVTIDGGASTLELKGIVISYTVTAPLP